MINVLKINDIRLKWIKDILLFSGYKERSRILEFINREIQLVFKY